VFDQFLDNGYMPRVQRGSGVVSPNHAGHTSYAAVDDVVIEWDVGPPE
jgi:predicted transcriptional regulator of viral defense system